MRRRKRSGSLPSSSGQTTGTADSRITVPSRRPDSSRSMNAKAESAESTTIIVRRAKDIKVVKLKAVRADNAKGTIKLRVRETSAGILTGVNRARADNSVKAAIKASAKVKVKETRVAKTAISAAKARVKEASVPAEAKVNKAKVNSGSGRAAAVKGSVRRVTDNADRVRISNAAVPIPGTIIASCVRLRKQCWTTTQAEMLAGQERRSRDRNGSTTTAPRVSKEANKTVKAASLAARTGISSNNSRYARRRSIIRRRK